MNARNLFLCFAILTVLVGGWSVRGRPTSATTDPARELIAVALKAHVAATGEATPERITLDSSSDLRVEEATEPCPRQPELAFGRGSVIELEDRDPPCRFVFRTTGVRLEASADGTRPDPGPTVVMDRSGRFYSANAPGFTSVISVWDAQGRFLTSFGRAGEGPGEFRGLGNLSLYVDGQNRLHVRDGGFAWSVFSPDHQFLRATVIGVPGMLLDERLTAILDNGSALTGDGYRSDRENYFRVVAPDGTLERSFGPVSPAVAQDESRPLDRLVAYRGGDAFWSGPRPGEDEGYVVEEWGLDGDLLRSVRRSVPWFGWRGGNEPSAGVLQLDATPAEGLLYVVLQRPTPEGRRAIMRSRQENRPIPREERYGLAEVVVEMIDIRSVELLASEVHLTESAMEFVPRALFPGTMRGYTYRQGRDHLPFVEIVAVELEAK